MLPLSEKMVAMASFSGENAAVGFLCRRDQETFSTQTIAENGLLETFGDVWRQRSCFDLFEMFFEVKESSFSSRFFSQIAPLSSLEEAVEPEVFHSQPSAIRHLINISAFFIETEVYHSQPSARTKGNRTCSGCRGGQQGKSLLLTFKQTIQNSF